jgi:hypothetical protein
MCELQAPAALPSESETAILPFCRNPVGGRYIQSGCCEEEKDLFLQAGIEPQSLCRPARSAFTVLTELSMFQLNGITNSMELHTTREATGCETTR